MKRFALFFFLFGCSTGSDTDGGADAPAEAAKDICDLDAFFASGGHDGGCSIPSTRMCFQPVKCPGTFCQCLDTSSGPRWRCVTDHKCFAQDAGPDADEDVVVDAPNDTGPPDTATGG